jgi:hypothetical protein
MHRVEVLALMVCYDQILSSGLKRFQKNKNARHFTSGELRPRDALSLIDEKHLRGMTKHAGGELTFSVHLGGFWPKIRADFASLERWAVAFLAGPDEARLALKRISLKRVNFPFLTVEGM